MTPRALRGMPSFQEFFAANHLTPMLALLRMCLISVTSQSSRLARKYRSIQRRVLKYHWRVRANTSCRMQLHPAGTQFGVHVGSCQSVLNYSYVFCDFAPWSFVFCDLASFLFVGDALRHSSVLMLDNLESSLSLVLHHLRPYKSPSSRTMMTLGGEEL